MYDKEALKFMERCSLEIQGLRNEIDYLKPKAEAFDCIKQILGYNKLGGMTSSEDLVWVLKKEMEKIKDKLKQEATEEKGNG